MSKAFKNLLQSLSRACQADTLNPIDSSSKCDALRQRIETWFNDANQCSVPAEDFLGRIRILKELYYGNILYFEGASGSGKSVLLSQIFKANAQRAVFVSMDVKLESLEEPQEGAAEGSEKAKGNHRPKPACLCVWECAA